MLAITELTRQIERGEVAPVYLLYGEERLLIEETVDLLRTQLIGDADHDLNYERFDFTEQPVQLALEAAETYPFLGDKRLVVGFGATFLSSGREKEKVEHDLEALEAYLENPAPYSVLVLILYHPKLDERKKLVRLLKKQAVVAEASSLKSKDLIPWLIKRAEQRQVQLNADAGALLHQFAGNDLTFLDRELAKMASYVGPGGTITTEVVHHLAAETTAHNVFELVNDVAEQNISRALYALDQLLVQNEEPIKIIFLLARQFRLMYEAKYLLKKGYPQRDLSRLMGVHPYVAKLASQHCKPFTLDHLARILKHLAQLDYQMKTGQIDKELALHLFILQSIPNQKGVPVI